MFEKLKKRIGQTFQAWSMLSISERDQSKMSERLFGIDKEVLIKEILLQGYNLGQHDYWNNREELLNKNQGWVFAASDRYAKAVMESPWGLYTETQDGDQLIENHFLYDIRSNSEPSPMILDYKTTYAVMWLGNSFWYKMKNEFGLPAKLNLIEPEWGTMKVEKNAYNEIVAYWLKTGWSVDPIRFEPDEIIHFYYPTINSGTYGRSPGNHIKATIDLDQKYKIFNNSIVDRGAFVSGMLSPSENSKMLSKEHREQVIAQLQSMTGAHRANSNGGILIPTIPMDFTDMQLSPRRDLDFAEGQRMNRDEITSVYSVAKSIITSDDVNRANAEAGIYIWMKLGVSPWLKLYADFQNRGLIKVYDQRMKMKYDNCVPEDEKLMAEINEILIRSGQDTPDETRAMREKKPHEGGVGSKPMYGGATLESVVRGGKKPVEDKKNNNNGNGKPVDVDEDTERN